MPPSESLTEIPQIPSAHTGQMHRLSSYKTATIDVVELIDTAIKVVFMSTYEHDPRLSFMWDRMVAAVANDEEYQTLVENIQVGFSKSRQDLPSVISWFWPMCEEFYCVKRVPILILPKLCTEVLESLHSGC